MIRMDEGPSLNWPPSEVDRLSEYEVKIYNEALKVFRDKYRELAENPTGR